jgi:hypothetical protein
MPGIHAPSRTSSRGKACEEEERGVEGEGVERRTKETGEAGETHETNNTCHKQAHFNRNPRPPIFHTT